MNQESRKVILGVTESDSHVVANHLIAYHLRTHGFEVINLGACTPVRDFVNAYAEHLDAEAILIGSNNGHALTDLAGLEQAKHAGLLDCPVILGGNLSVGADKDPDFLRHFAEIGVDHILDRYESIIPLLDGMLERSRPWAFARA
jgi:methylaspartate mutase sigma subunit